MLTWLRYIGEFRHEGAAKPGNAEISDGGPHEWCGLAVLTSLIARDIGETPRKAKRCGAASVPQRISCHDP